MVSTVKFSQFVAGSLSNTTNTLVGVSSPSGGQNIQFSFPLKWNTAGRPSSPASGVLGYNTSLSQYEFWNGAAWVQLAAGGSGSVNVGSINELAWYAANGSAVSGLMTQNNSVLVTSSGGVPSLSTTLPASLTIPQPNIVGVTNGSNAAVGSVGELISSVILSGSPVSLTTNTPTNVTSISLTAGDWDVEGNVAFGISSSATVTAGWSSEFSAILPDAGLYNIQSSLNTAGSSFSIPYQRYSLSVTTTIYLSVQANFPSGTVAVIGGIYARRVR